MYHHPVLKWLTWISWVITALVTINTGMLLFNYDFFSSNFFMMNLADFARLIYWIILLAGLYSAALIVMKLAGICPHGGKGKCKC